MNMFTSGATTHVRSDYGVNYTSSVPVKVCVRDPLVPSIYYCYWVVDP